MLHRFERTSNKISTKRRAGGKYEDGQLEKISNGNVVITNSRLKTVYVLTSRAQKRDRRCLNELRAPGPPVPSPRIQQQYLPSLQVSRERRECRLQAMKNGW